MAKVYSKAANAEIEVPAAEAQRGLAAGEYVLRGTARVIGPEHRTGTVDAADAATAFAQGWRLADDDEVADAKIRREESGVAGSLLGTVEQTAAGATLGLSTLGLNALLGDEYTERARIRREELGEAGTAAEVIGGVGAAVVPGLGQIGLAARGGTAARGLGTAARVVASPTTAAARLGGAVERGVASLGVGRTGALAARGTVEGGLAAAGAEVHESVLGGHEITAERLGAAGLTGMALGGLLGGGAPVAADLAVGALKAPVAATRKVLGRAIGAPGGEVSTAAAQAFESAGQTTAGERWLDSYASLMGIDPEVMRKGYGLTKTPRGRELIFRDLNDVRAETASAGKLALDDHNAAFAGVLDNITGRKKLAKLETLLDGVDESAVRDQSAAVLASARQHLDDALAKPDAATSYVANDLRAAQGWHERAIREIATSVDDPKVATFRAMERFKQDVDNLVKRRMKAAKGVVSPQLDDTIKLLRRVTSGGEDEFTGEVIPGVRPFLESDVWGAAGELQRTQNAALSGGMRAVENLRAKSPKLAKMFEIGAEVDEDAVLNFVRSYTKSGGKTRANLVEDVLTARERALKVAKENYDVDADDLAKIAKAEKSIADLRARLTDLSETADASEVMSAIRRAAGGGSPSITTLSTLGPALGGTVGAAFGPLGAAAGFALGRITDPFNTLRSIAAVQTTASKLSSLMGLADRVDLGILKGTGGLASKIAGTAAKAVSGTKRAARRAGVALPIPTVFAAHSHQSRQEHVEKVRDVATMLATNPSALADRVAKITESFSDAAPHVARQLQVVTQRAAMHLAKHIPPSYAPPLSGRKPLMEPVAFEAFTRRVEAIEDPIATIGRLADGTFTREHAEALREVYPELYAQARQQVMDAILQAQADGRTVPHEARVQAGVFLEVTTDASLDPKTYAGIQAAMAASPEPQQQPTAPPQGGKVRAGAKVDLAEGATTSNERIASGVARA